MRFTPFTLLASLALLALADNTPPPFNPSTPPKYTSYASLPTSSIYHPDTINTTTAPFRPTRPRQHIDAFTNAPRCQTTPQKPTSEDVMWTVKYFYSISNKFCCQTGRGRACTVMGVYRSAVVRICGYQDQCVRCGYTALGAEEIVRHCERSYNGVARAGGVFEWQKGEEIFVGGS